MCTTTTTTTTSFEVEVKEMVLVSPPDPTPTHVLPLSSLDSQLFLRFTIEYLLLYRTSSTNRVATATRFKEALARALVPYYPLAGRVRPRSDGKYLEVVCRSQGALFIQAESVSQEEDLLDEFAEAPTTKNRWRSLLSVHVDDVLCGLPPLIVQLTWLAHGEAFAVGVGINHCICDGIGSAEFLNLFAELVSSGNDDLAEFKRKPIWDRHLLNPVPTRTPVLPISHPEFSRVPDISGFVTRFNHETLSPTSTVFSKKSLNELKKLAYSTTSRLSSGVEFTCFEVLSAHVWRSWARSLNLPAQQTLRILFSVNIRHRVKPSLPSGFYGNGFILGCAQTTVKKLVNRGLGYGAELVRRAKERIDDEYVRSVVESVSEEKSCPDPVGVLIVSQWSRLGLEKVDFGAGKPVHVGPVCSDRYCLFLPVFGDRDAVKVMVAVPNSAVGRYEYLARSPYC